MFQIFFVYDIWVEIPSLSLFSLLLEIFSSPNQDYDLRFCASDFTDVTYLPEKKISPPHFTDETKYELIKMRDDNGETFERSLVKIKKVYKTD